MTTTDEWGALARRAEAANDDIGIAYSTAADEWVITCNKPTMLFLTLAANPATILRLIRELRGVRGDLAAAMRTAEDYNAERDRLAARLAAVEALTDTLDADLAAADPAHFSIGLMRGRLKTLRAVLSAAPTDTTKETP